MGLAQDHLRKVGQTRAGFPPNSLSPKQWPNRFCCRIDKLQRLHSAWPTFLMNGLRNGRPQTTSSSSLRLSTDRRPGHWLANQVVNWSKQLNNLLYRIMVQATFHVRLQLAGHVPCIITVGKDMLQPLKTYDSYQSRAYVPEKAYPYDMIMQTTNQAARRLERMTYSLVIERNFTPTVWR